MGFRFNWKGARGPEVPWIGANVRIGRAPYGTGAVVAAGVMVTLSPAKFKELQGEVEDVHAAKGMIPLKKVQKIAGQLSWASGIFPWIRGFNSCLWAAIASHTREHAFAAKFSSKKRPMQLFFALRVQQAIAWIRMLLAGVVRDRDGEAIRVQRWASVASRAAELMWCVRTDASPFGMGGILFKAGRPVAWFAEEWSQNDLALFHAERGDPAWQADWELFAVLVAIDVWLPRLRGQAMCLLQTDATAALPDAARLAGRTPAMNAIAAELALRLECAHVQAVPEHLSGTLNFQCDALSRMALGAALPAALAGVPRVSPRSPEASFFWAWPRALLQAQ